MPKWNALRLVTGVAIALMGIGSATQTHALGRVPPPSQAATSCVLRVDPVLPGQRVSAGQFLGCYASFSQAIVVATGGRVNLPSTVSASTVTQSELQSTGPSPLTTTCTPDCTGTVIGIDYRDANFGGDNLIYTTGNSAGCSNGANFYWSSMPAGWNDVVSSAKAFQGCQHFIHWVDINFSGGQRDCQTSCSYIGDLFNDKTSSVALKQVA